MTWLSPWSAVVAAAVTLPLLLLLYFLRLRRQRVSVASTLLWQKSFEDLQVNAPFQRLRWSVLLLLQLLLLSALLLALAQPILRADGPGASRVVLLIDRSASMSARIAPQEQADSPDHPLPTRLEAAKELARQLIEGLGGRGKPQQMMIVAFGVSPHIVAAFETDRRALIEAVDSIAPTDEPADLEAALQLAGAFASAGEEDDAEPPDILLLSDGGVGGPGDPAGYQLRAGNFRFVQVVQSTSESSPDDSQAIVDNVGITSLGVRRDDEEPGQVAVFARLVNAGPQPIETAITMLVDGQPEAVIRKTVPPAGAHGAGEESISRAVELPGGAVVQLRHDHRDDLAADDEASIVLPPPARPRIALVHPDNARADDILHDLLAALEPQKLEVISAGAFALLDAERIDSGALFDLVVFDRLSGMRLPGAASLTIGGVPAGLSAEPPAREGGQRILSWDRQHPLMRNVALDTIIYAGFGGYDLPATAKPLASGPDGPIIATLRSHGARHVMVGFELVQSNWPWHVSNMVFLQNVLDYLAMADSGRDGVVFRPGDPITVRAAPETRELSIEGPLRAMVAVEPGAMVSLPALHRVGLYTVEGAAPPHDRIAVSLLSDDESDIRPRSTIAVNAQEAAARTARAVAPQPLWPWLVAAAFVLLVLEWLVYCRRVRGG